MCTQRVSAVAYQLLRACDDDTAANYACGSSPGAYGLYHVAGYITDKQQTLAQISCTRPSYLRCPLASIVQHDLSVCLMRSADLKAARGAHPCPSAAGTARRPRQGAAASSGCILIETLLFLLPSVHAAMQGMSATTTRTEAARS